jgi:hypothetical protein
MIVTACLMAVQVHYVDFSNQARGYTGFILFGALSCCLFLMLCENPRLKIAISYVTATSLACGFLLPALCFPLAHLVTAAAWTVKEIWLQQRRDRILHWGRVLIACTWGILFGLLMNALTTPQVIDYARNRSDSVHLVMGVTLGLGILQYISGAYHLSVIIVLLVAASLGWFGFRGSPYLLGAVLVPPLVYLAGFTVLGLRGSPRLFLSLAFPVVLGLGLFAYRQWGSRSVWRRVMVMAVLGAFILDGAPELLSYYRVGNPGLRKVAQRLPAEQLLLVGEYSGRNLASRSKPNPATSYYFPRSRWIPWTDEGASLVQLAGTDHSTKYIIFETARCPDGELKGIEELGYHRLERLASWRNVYPVSKERGTRICYVVYGR